MRLKMLSRSAVFVVNENFKIFTYRTIYFRNFFTSIQLNGMKNALKRNPIRILDKSGKEITSTKNKKSNIPENLKFALSRWNENKVVKVDPVALLPTIKYEVAKENLDKFAQILMTVKCQKEGEDSGKVMLEGIRLINDALAAGIKPEMFLFSQLETLAKLRIKIEEHEDIKIYKVMYKTMQVWSSLKTCPGIIGIFKKPSGDMINAITQPALPVTIICHNITDGGKLGTIIRSAAAVGCKAVLIMKGCINAWKHTVLRSGSGAHFRIPIITNIDWTYILNYIPEKASLFLVNNRSHIRSIEGNNECFMDFMQNWDSDEEAQITEKAPSDTYVQSEDEFSDSSNETRIPSRFRTLTDKKIDIVDETYEESSAAKYANLYIPQLTYTDVLFPKTDIVLFISDNEKSADPRAVKLSTEFGGRELNIPFENNIQQINPALALSIVLYEIRRQISEKYVLVE